MVWGVASGNMVWGDRIALCDFDSSKAPKKISLSKPTNPQILNLHKSPNPNLLISTKTSLPFGREIESECLLRLNIRSDTDIRDYLVTEYKVFDGESLLPCASTILLE